MLVRSLQFWLLTWKCLFLSNLFFICIIYYFYIDRIWWPGFLLSIWFFGMCAHDLLVKLLNFLSISVAGIFRRDCCIASILSTKDCDLLLASWPILYFGFYLVFYWLEGHTAQKNHIDNTFFLYYSHSLISFQA